MRDWIEMLQWVLNCKNRIFILASRFHRALRIRFNPTITPHVPWSLLLRWNTEETENPLCSACSGHTLSILLLLLPTQPARVFCAVSDLHIKTCSEQEWELMSCLLCAVLSEINRPRRMKGPCVTKGSKGKFLMNEISEKELLF